MRTRSRGAASSRLRRFTHKVNAWTAARSSTTIPKVQFTLICADEHVDGIVEIICNAARTGAVGDGKIWVEPVEEVIRIRTGEHGPAAV